MAQHKIRSMSFFDKSYCRENELPALLGLLPGELPQGQGLLDLLASSLEREKRAGRKGSWHYDLNRHIRLLQALKAEKADLQQEARP